MHHFVSKARAAGYMFKSGIPSSAVQIACYYEVHYSPFLPLSLSSTIHFSIIPIFRPFLLYFYY